MLSRCSGSSSSLTTAAIRAASSTARQPVAARHLSVLAASRRNAKSWFESRVVVSSTTTVLETPPPCDRRRLVTLSHSRMMPIKTIEVRFFPKHVGGFGLGKATESEQEKSRGEMHSFILRVLVSNLFPCNILTVINMVLIVMLLSVHLCC